MVKSRQSLYIGAVLVSSILLGFLSVWILPLSINTSSLWILAALVLLVALAGRFPFKVSPQADATLNTVPLFAAILLFHPIAAASAAIVGTLISERLLKAPLKVMLFNIGLNGASALMSGITFWILRPETDSALFDIGTAIAALTSGVVLQLCILLLMTGMVTIIKGIGFWQIWKDTWAFEVVLDASFLIIGFVGAQLISLAWWWLIALIAPSAAAYYGLRRSVNESLEKNTEMALRIEAMEALEEREQEARLLSKENAVMAEIGRVFSSSLNIGDVFDRFAQEAHKVIDFDGISIALIEPENTSGNSFTTWGDHIPGLADRDAFAMAGSIVESTSLNGTGIRIDLENCGEMLRGHPDIQAVFQNGIDVLMFVPIMSVGRAIGFLTIWSLSSQKYDERALNLANRISMQISGAIVNSQLYDKLEVNQQSLRQLTQRVVAAHEEERRRVSRELHDEAGQALTGLKLILKLLQSELESESHCLHQRISSVLNITDNAIENMTLMAKIPTSQEILGLVELMKSVRTTLKSMQSEAEDQVESRSSRVNSAIEMIESTVEGIRRLGQDLRPPELDEMEIDETLRAFCAEFSERAHLAVHYDGADIDEQSNEISLSLYRCLQEALNNVVKHSNASSVFVKLSDDSRTISLSVEDDGKGFVISSDSRWLTESKGLGLLGIKERFEMLGGTLEITSHPGIGTRLVAHIPKEG